MVFDVLLRPADAVHQVVAAAHGAVGVHHYVVGLIHVEWCAVCHAEDVDALAHRVLVGHFVKDISM